MKILVGCECSGTVRDAFAALGHDAWSCDILPSVNGGQHILGDVRGHLEGWDMLILHPVCTVLAGAAAWAFKDGPYHQKVKPGTLTGEARRKAREDQLAFVRLLMDAPCERIAIENPVGSISTYIRESDQRIQPHQFGDDASKKTCLWLKGLPPLTPTKHIPPRIVDGKPRWANQTDSGQNKLSPSDDRASKRSITYPGIAKAMAEQWGAL